MMTDGHVQEVLDLERRKLAIQVAAFEIGIDDKLKSFERRMIDAVTNAITGAVVDLKADIIHLEERFDARFDRVEQRLDKVEQRLDKVEQRLDKVEQRLDKVEQRLDKVEQRLDRLEDRFTEFEGEFGHVKDQLERHLVGCGGL